MLLNFCGLAFFLLLLRVISTGCMGLFGHYWSLAGERCLQKWQTAKDSGMLNTTESVPHLFFYIYSVCKKIQVSS